MAATCIPERMDHNHNFYDGDLTDYDPSVFVFRMAAIKQVQLKGSEKTWLASVKFILCFAMLLFSFSKSHPNIIESSEIIVNS